MISQATFLFWFGLVSFFSSPFIIPFYALFVKNELSFIQKYSLIYVKFGSIHSILLMIGFCLSMEMDFMLEFVLIFFTLSYIFWKCNRLLIRDGIKQEIIL